MSSGTDTSAPARIRILPERLANQIAAGEVVERPASVLKELLENSLDAGARRIHVDIEHGGEQLIRVRDDGVGIHREDLAMALGRHATSKIASLEDLENIASLGFRGEALPSIASVSRLELSSCPAGADSGWKLGALEHGQLSAPQPASHPPGTTVSVRDLFYNTPARRKFLRTERTEYRHLEDVLKRAALSRFDCAFSLRHNARECYSLASATSDPECARRVAKLCGAAFVEQALKLDFEASELQLSGWIGAPGYSRGVADLQYFFVNGRMVRDNLLRHAVRHAHHGVVDSGRQPAYVLYLNLNPAQVDVNVHPSKHEVRFRDARSVHDFIVRSVRQAMSVQSDPGDGELREDDALSAQHAEFSSRMDTRLPISGNTLREHTAAYRSLRTLEPESPAPADRALGDALQHIERRYVVARNNQGLVLVDARRASRQVATARVQSALEKAPMVARPLLVPVAVGMRESRADLLEKHAVQLERLGIDLRRVSPTSISCRGVPAALAAASPEALVRCVAEALERDNGVGEVPAALPAPLCRVLEQCDLTAGWSWDRETMNELLRDLERLDIACESQSGEAIWRQLSAEDMAALLEGQRG